MEPQVDVVILAWNDGQLLDAAVKSVRASAGVHPSIYVVDNGSDAPVESPSDSVVRVIRNVENRGVSAGRNQGVRAGTSRLVCLLDSDARLEPECLARLATALEPEGVALAAPVFVDQAPEASAGQAPTVWMKLQRGLNLRSTYEPGRVSAGIRDVDFAIGACQMFDRSAFDLVGGLDESYFYGPEDVDFCLRLREAGYRVVQVESARCIHPPRRRNKKLLTRRGLRHGWAVARHLWRHRSFHRVVGGPPP